MADSYCIAELKETIENINAELIQSRTKISELDAKVREQAESVKKEIRKLQEENVKIARDLKEKEEKCRIVQEKWELAEQRLAQFSQKPNTTVEESLAQNDVQKECQDAQITALNRILEDMENKIKRVNESNDDALNINSLPNEIILNVFGYLEQNELGQISRVCSRWNVLTKSPLLWKTVNVTFSPSHTCQTTVADSFISGLPSCVTSIKLDFVGRDDWKSPLDFAELCLRLQEKCPDLEKLILNSSEISKGLSSVIGLCSQFLQDVKNLSFRSSHFGCDRSTDDRFDISKIKILELHYCVFDSDNESPFSKLPHLEQLHLFRTVVPDSWFKDDASFLNQLHVLNVGINMNSDLFSTILNRGHNLKELYLCNCCVPEYDLTFTDSALSHLKIICLSCTSVTCEGVVSLIRSCPSLEIVYVGKDVAESFAAHPFVVADRSKSGIVKSIDEIHNHTVDYSHI